MLTIVLISKRPVCNESELSSCITCLISLVTSDYLFDGLHLVCLNSVM